MIILLREQDGTEKNPFGFEERVKRITVELGKEGFKLGEDFEILQVPNITHITYGRDVGYSIEQEFLGEDIESISATEIRKQLEGK